MREDAFPRAAVTRRRTALRDRALGLRDRMLASEAFRRWAIAFPLTRGIARRRARSLFDIVAGFAYSQTLYACVRLDLFATLADEPRTAEELAASRDLPIDSMRMLLRAAASLQLLEKRGDERFGLGPLGASLIGLPGVAAMVEHHAMFYADLADPVRMLRERPRDTRLGAFWPYAHADSRDEIELHSVKRYCALMGASQHLVAEEILAADPFAGRRRLLDVGGGDGSFAIEAARRHAKLAVGLCDLPAVAALARENIVTKGFGARIEVVACDFKSQPLPVGADVISLVRVLHDHDDTDAIALLRAILHALPPGGGVVVAEPMSDAKAAQPVGDAYFGFYLLAMGSGRPRAPAEIAGMLQQAGFENARRIATRMPLVAEISTASKPLDVKCN